MTESATGFDGLRIDALRRRRTMKWTRYPSDVLPAWVAEMDYPIAPVVSDAVRDVLRRDDLGYPVADGLAEAFAGWAGRQQGWTPDPALMTPVADVMAGVEAALRQLTAPGEPVVLPTPAYPPFFALLADLRRPVVECPLVEGPDGWRLDLDRIAAALRAGARAVLLCHPHNPTGTIFPRDELAGLADLVTAYGAVVVSDEIHAPLLSTGAVFVPYAVSSPSAAQHTVTVTSVSKAWNVPGLKCALLAAQPGTAGVAAGVPERERIRASVPGIAVSIAAWTDDGGWLDAVRGYLDRTRDLVTDWVAGQPTVRWCRGGAGYLAWLDLRAAGLGDDPAVVLLDRGRVALSRGPTFASPGAGTGDGFARLNHATSLPILAEILARLSAVLADR